ncbi:hypothetical protein P171DRAFT_191826 [Karstenula rhodostoma CBS 690.94]|uniref:Uncharacterized protein n=1 Tax=Karstenula rhodostoma CBS 690.94 TaxID=1392251 RepID=A0A9P4PV75_9PLEO|nr:hypothetical protein P171DRAFT_191826 [Karstenula rhodostoma CBS 690.94]
MNANAGSYTSNSHQLFPAPGQPQATTPRPEPCIYCRTFYNEYHQRNPNGSKLPLDALDTLSSTNMRTSAQAYFDAARATSMRAQLGFEMTNHERQRACFDMGNARLLDRLGAAIDNLKEKQKWQEQQEQESVKLRVRNSEIKQENADLKQMYSAQEKEKAELLLQIVALRHRVQDENDGQE